MKLSRLQRVLRARRERARAWRRLRVERLRLGADVAREEERALLGALILEPAMIRVAAKVRPPAWFTDERCLLVMRALFCVSSHPHLVDLDAVVEALERHDALELVGGEDAIRALVEPRPALDAARAALEEIRARLPPIEEEPIVRFAGRLLGGELAG